MTPCKRLLVLPDMHVIGQNGRLSGIDVSSMRAVMKYASDANTVKRWDHVICLGDLLDFNVLSSHNKGKPRLVEGQRIQEQFCAGSHVLQTINNMVKPKGLSYFIEGNHEYRAVSYMGAHPEQSDLWSVPDNLKLKDMGWEWVPYWSKGKVLTFGKATFIHGRYTGSSHPTAHLTAYLKSVFYGHTHSIESRSLTTEGDYKTRVAQSLGCLCVKPEWLKGAPNKWMQGFAEFSLYADGYYCYTVHPIYKNRFTAGGVTYDGNNIPAAYMPATY